jgi:hypothetical protein
LVRVITELSAPSMAKLSDALHGSDGK